MTISKSKDEDLKAAQMRKISLLIEKVKKEASTWYIYPAFINKFLCQYDVVYMHLGKN